VPRLLGLRYRDSAGIALLLSLQLRPQQIPALVTALREGSGGHGAEGFALDAGEAVDIHKRPVASMPDVPIARADDLRSWNLSSERSSSRTSRVGSV